MYDVVVIGAGAGGLTTALYTARANLKTLIIEKGVYGGQMQNTAEIENYSGFGLITGMELSQNMYDQAISQGVEYKYGEVVSVEKQGNQFTVNLKGKEPVLAKSVVISTGVKHRQLGVDGEEEFAGLGVSYCALCDGAFFKNTHVAVVGGGDSALDEANYLTGIVDKVTIIHRGSEFSGQKVLQDRVFNNPKINVLFNTQVDSIYGGNKVQGLSLLQRDNIGYREIEFDVDGMFIYIGLDPITEPFKDMGILDNNSYIVTNEKMETSIKGLFAVGDVRQKDVRQIATAVGDGAIAGVEVNKYLEELS